jgi:hypothetical protein
MFALNLPKYEIKVTDRKGKKYIWDIIRRKYIRLTPEEWVRQHFVHFMIKHKHYPSSYLANEIQIELNGLKKRCDTVFYSSDLTPKIIIEYKAPSVEITQKTFTQICNYNWSLKADYLIVSNGIKHYCCKMDYVHQTYHFITEIPDYKTL